MQCAVVVSFESELADEGSADSASVGVRRKRLHIHFVTLPALLFLVPWK